MGEQDRNKKASRPQSKGLAPVVRFPHYWGLGGLLGFLFSRMSPLRSPVCSLKWHFPKGPGLEIRVF